MPERRSGPTAAPCQLLHRIRHTDGTAAIHKPPGPRRELHPHVGPAQQVDDLAGDAVGIECAPRAAGRVPRDEAADGGRCGPTTGTATAATPRAHAS